MQKRSILFGIAVVVLSTIIGACSSSDDGTGILPVVPTTNPDGTPIAAGSTMSWTFTDQCNDGADTQVRFHEFESSDSGNRTGWSWPGGSGVYVVDVAEASFELTCTAPGRKICYGARADNAGYWGVDLDGTQSCTDCCDVCEAEPVTKENINLVCSADG